MEPDASLITQMRKGALQYCVLAMLRGRERYGYELVRSISEVEGLDITEGTIYPLLSRLKREKLVTTRLVESEEGRARRYYRLTMTGEVALASFEVQWNVFSKAVDKVLHQGGEL